MNLKIFIISLCLLFFQGVGQAQMYYQTTNNLYEIIQYQANQQGVDRLVLEALTKTLMNNKAELSGFYSMQLGSYPGMSAEALVESLTKVMSLCEVIYLNKKQDAIANGQSLKKDLKMI